MGILSEARNRFGLRFFGVTFAAFFMAASFSHSSTVFAQTATGASFQDCGYNKLSSQSFRSRALGFVGAVSHKIREWEKLSGQKPSNRNLTEAVYASGLLQRVPGCIHAKEGRNVEILLGDVVNNNRAASGFTVIVRGLPSKLCETIKQDTLIDGAITVRSELVGRQPGPPGQCVNNPVTGFFGMFGTGALPEPNTAYFFQKLPDDTPPSSPNKCPRLSWDGGNRAYPELDRALATIASEKTIGAALLKHVKKNDVALRVCESSIATAAFYPATNEIKISPSYYEGKRDAPLVRTLLEELAHTWGIRRRSDWPNPETLMVGSTFLSREQFIQLQKNYMLRHEAWGWLIAQRAIHEIQNANGANASTNVWSHLIAPSEAPLKDQFEKEWPDILKLYDQGHSAQGYSPAKYAAEKVEKYVRRSCQEIQHDGTKLDIATEVKIKRYCGLFRDATNSSKMRKRLVTYEEFFEHYAKQLLDCKGELVHSKSGPWACTGG